MDAANSPKKGRAQMVDITVSIPEYIKGLIDEQVAEGKFESETDVLIQAVHQMLAPDIDWSQDAEFLEAIEQVERGEYIVVDDIGAYFDRLVEEAHEAALNGAEIPDDLIY
jgi:Arc/MetJ-type ribon-helix-helix transcriptional regulator